MNLARLKLLEQYAKDDPNDPFPIYALALEWMKMDPPKAEELFDTLLTNHPDYLPVYYHAGKIYITSGDLPKAKHILETGIQKTRASGDRKALAELQSLYDELD